MNFILQKGVSKTLTYESVDFPVLDANWSGYSEFYSAYPGAAVVTIDMELVGNKLVLNVLAEDILNLTDGVYYLVSTIQNATTGYATKIVEHATVLPISVSAVPMTTISMTIGKVDGTPAGKETRELVNTDTGTTIVLGWKGVAVTASHPIADEVTGIIIGTETVSTETNAAGYAQFAVIKGQTVTVSCPSFGKTVTVDTTGHDSIDLSSYF